MEGLADPVVNAAFYSLARLTGASVDERKPFQPLLHCHN